jgi:hypothetical protein
VSRIEITRIVLILLVLAMLGLTVFCTAPTAMNGVLVIRDETGVFHETFRKRTLHTHWRYSELAGLDVLRRVP